MGFTRPLPALFEVSLDPPPPGGDAEREYGPGDEVSGRVRLRVTAPGRLRELRLLALGQARATPSGGRGLAAAAGGGVRRLGSSHSLTSLSSLRQQQQQQRQEYLRREERLVTSDQEVTLNPDKVYEYTFAFRLPQGPLAPSFRGKYGEVSYAVTAYLEQEHLPTLEANREFRVVQAVDVNTPSLMSPVGGSKEKKVTFFFLSDGYVCIAAKIDRRGYCPGDEIAINAQFQNHCSRIVVPKAAILAKQTYLVHGRSRVFREKLPSVRGDHIITGRGDVWQGKRLRIPTRVSPSLTSNLICLEYSLLIYVHIPGTDKLVLELPLVIGNVPRSGLSSRTPSLTSDERSLASDSSSSLSWPHFEFPEQMGGPPSYMQRCDSLNDCPTSPLLDEYDGVPDSPIFMYIPPPPPPASHTQVDENGNTEGRVAE